MNSLVTQQSFLSITLAVVFAGGLACTAPLGGAESSAAEQRGAASAPRIEHVSPARDSMGETPKRFEWTPVAGADSYSIGVWSEVDRLMWRQHNLPSTFAEWPRDVEAEFGTYYWSVVAIKDGRPIAESGRSAFIVR